MIIGAPFYDEGEEDEGKVFVWKGYPTIGLGINATSITHPPDWTATSDQIGANFGICVSSAGDINCDGKCDVIVGSWKYDNGQTDEGSAFAWYSTSFNVIGNPLNADWSAESDQPDAYFGLSVASAGDVNFDGKNEIIIGAYQYDNGQTDEGRAFLYSVSCEGSAPCQNFDNGSTYSWIPNVITMTTDQPGPSGLQSDLFLKITDQSGGPSIAYNVIDYSGDWNQYIGKCLCWDYKVFDDGDPGSHRPVTPRFYIYSQFDPNPHIGAWFDAFTITELDGWVHICAPIEQCIGGVLPGNSPGSMAHYSYR